MDEPRTRWGAFAAAALGAAALLLLLSMAGHRRFDPAAALAIAGAAFALELCVGALALARYRQSHDPQALFVGAGFVVLAIQEALFGIWWPLTHDARHVIAVTFGTIAVYDVPGAMKGMSGPAPVYCWLVGWVAAGNLFFLAMPRRDRRGKPPVRPVKVFGFTLVVVVIIDLVLFWTYRWPTTNVGPIGQVAVRSDLGVLGWFLGGAAAILLFASAARDWRAASRERPLHIWLSIAYLLALPMVIAVVRKPTPGTPFVQPADLLAPMVAGLAFVGFLLDQRSESSRQRRTTDRAEGVLSGRAEIASMIAHEVRGPAATVRGIASTSLTHYDRLSDDERREFLGMIETESRRLMTTVDQMSLALKVDARSLRLDLVPQDLGGMVRAGVEAVGAADGRIEVETEAGIMVPADRTRMIEVVRQLVDNAVKYSPADQPVHVSSRREGPDAVIEIVDEGPGIPIAERGLVFEKFPNWRPSGYEEQPGTGLGLFICRGLVAEHSGEISMEDGPGGGTMLRVRLPVEG